LGGPRPTAGSYRLDDLRQRLRDAPGTHELQIAVLADHRDAAGEASEPMGQVPRRIRRLARDRVGAFPARRHHLPVRSEVQNVGDTINHDVRTG